MLLCDYILLHVLFHYNMLALVGICMCTSHDTHSVYFALWYGYMHLQYLLRQYSFGPFVSKGLKMAAVFVVLHTKYGRPVTSQSLPVMVTCSTIMADLWRSSALSTDIPNKILSEKPSPETF